MLGRGGKHHEQTHGVRTVTVNQCFGVHRVSLGLGHLRAVFQHHALRQQLVERLIVLAQAHVTHQLVEKTGIQKMQHGMLDAPDILVHRHPVAHAIIQHGGLIVRTAITCEIPA